MRYDFEGKQPYVWSEKHPTLCQAKCAENMKEMIPNKH